MKELISIQQTLSVPKTRHNGFGGYNYRSCEDIYEALKPVLLKNSCLLTFSESIVQFGDRYYIESTATLTNDKGQSESCTSYAREELQKKKSDSSQLTGSATSYARKYAMNGLFLLDDSVDPDSTRPEEKEDEFLKRIRIAKDRDSLMDTWRILKDNGKLNDEYEQALKDRNTELENLKRQ
jgi:hypothetical protein